MIKCTTCKEDKKKEEFKKKGRTLINCDFCRSINKRINNNGFKCEYELWKDKEEMPKALIMYKNAQKERNKKYQASIRNNKDKKIRLMAMMKINNEKSRIKKIIREIESGEYTRKKIKRFSDKNHLDHIKGKYIDKLKEIEALI